VFLPDTCRESGRELPLSRYSSESEFTTDSYRRNGHDAELSDDFGMFAEIDLLPSETGMVDERRFQS